MFGKLTRAWEYINGRWWLVSQCLSRVINCDSNLAVRKMLLKSSSPIFLPIRSSSLHCPPHLRFLPHSPCSCASFKQAPTPIVQPPTTCLHPPPALWSGPIRIQAEQLIMQAAVSPFRWDPPGDSSTASDWGCATEPDSSTNNTEKRMLMDQIRWVLRWEEGARGRGGGRWQALLISCHSDEASCVRKRVFVVRVWARRTGRPGLRPQLLTCFPSTVPWSLRDEARVWTEGGMGWQRR